MVFSRNTFSILIHCKYIELYVFVPTTWYLYIFLRNIDDEEIKKCGITCNETRLVTF